MKFKGIVTVMLTALAAVVIAAAPVLAAQAPQEHQHATEQATAQPDMMAKCQAMMADRDKMMAEMKASDERLDDLASKMSAASGPEKVDAIAVVVSETVSQRRTMREGMMKMQGGMMAHRMEHMQAGPDSMTMCPMMKTMKPMGDAKH